MAFESFGGYPYLPVHGGELPIPSSRESALDMTRKAVAAASLVSFGATANVNNNVRFGNDCAPSTSFGIHTPMATQQSENNLNDRVSQSQSQMNPANMRLIPWDNLPFIDIGTNQTQPHNGPNIDSNMFHQHNDRPLSNALLSMATCNETENNSSSASCTIGNYTKAELMPPPASSTTVSGSRPEPANRPVKGIRKRKPQPDMWKTAKLKKAHARGEEYVNRRGKLVPAKSLKPPCQASCRLKCTKNFSSDDREKIFTGFYSLDTDGKRCFIANTSQQLNPACKRTKKEVSRRQNTFKYFFELDKKRQEVCRTFYLSTIAVSHKMVHGVHYKKDSCTGMPKMDGRGKSSGSSRKMPEEKRKGVIDHVTSLAAVDKNKPHKLYFEPGLDITKMYRLYLEKCVHEGHEPVKESYYRHVMNTEFKINFNKVKKTPGTPNDNSIINQKRKNKYDN